MQNSTSFLPPDNQNILEAGANNIIGLQSSDCSIIGINNELRFNDKNSLIVGDRNVINDDVNNTIVSGTTGDATATNSIVLGGNTTLAGTNPLGNELVLNGDFSQVGSEEVTNGDFSNGETAWTFSAQCEVINDQARILSIDGSFQYISQNNVFDTSKYYKLEFDVISSNGATLGFGGGIPDVQTKNFR